MLHFATPRSHQGAATNHQPPTACHSSRSLAWERLIYRYGYPVLRRRADRAVARTSCFDNARARRMVVYQLGAPDKTQGR
jgi:hypothetical protein